MLQVSDLQERVAIVEAENTIRRQHAHMTVGSSAPAAAGERPANVGGGAPPTDTDRGGAQAILESRLAVQVGGAGLPCHSAAPVPAPR